jgi:hypothetical protein
MKTLLKISIFVLALSNPKLETKQFNNCLKAVSFVVRNKKAQKKKISKKIELIATK